MRQLTCSLLSAGAFSCALHILLLGLAASVSVALPAHPVIQVHVTLLQRAVPLSVQDLPKGGGESKEVPLPQSPPPEVARPNELFHGLLPRRSLRLLLHPACRNP